MRRRLVWIAVAVAALTGAVAGGRHLLKVSEVASAFFAKRVCSGVFVSGRGTGAVIAEDVLADMTRGFGKFGATVDRERRLVTASLFGFARRRALYRPGLGCTLINGTSVDALLAQTKGFTPVVPALNSGALWPEGERVEAGSSLAGVDADRLRAAVETAFSEPRENTLRRTRAVVVVWRGRIIAERYAPGIAPATPLAGWSMGKGIASALAGILVGEGKLDVDKAGLFPAWRGEGDPRGGITLGHLLRMTSGLDFDAPQARMLSDVRKMLFLKGDAARYARGRPSIAPPGESWIYGSGSSILVSDLIRRSSGETRAEQFNFPRRALFAPLGMTSAVLEPDAAGTFLAAAFAYASARDWARFGLFLLKDGVWEGRRILPEGWMRYSLMATGVSGGQYGAHFWRRVPDFLRPHYVPDRTLPDDRFYLLGHDGQMVAIIPSRELVVVRLGLSRRRNAWDPDELVADVLRTLPGGG
jgi:CubicO group peptidase (beta-lactamase class C family)